MTALDRTSSGDRIRYQREMDVIRARDVPLRVWDDMGLYRTHCDSPVLIVRGRYYAWVAPSDTVGGRMRLFRALVAD